jgi:Uma2 family endonuclease
MSSSAAHRLPTFAELYQAIEALPAGLTGEILEPGVIRTLGRPGGPHRIGARRIWRALGGDDAGEGGHGWWLEQEAEIRLLGDRLAVPDLSGWRLADDAPVPPAFVYQNPMVRIPDWCCEILSATTERIDREVKVPLYVSSGVEWIWLVDPQAHRLEVLQARGGAAALVEKIAGEGTRVIPPFASTVDLSRWWVPPAPDR